MAVSSDRLVIKFAILSRASLLVLQAVCNYLVQDHNAGAFTTTKQKEVSKLDKLVDVAFGGLTRWDSQYFLHIAEHSYTYENTLAFFPLYPFTVHLLSNCIFHVSSSFISYYSCAIISGVILNFIYFVLATYFLYKLSTCMLKSPENVLLTAVLFCINPASIFFTALYSECLFSLLTFSAMYYIEKDCPFRAAVLIGLSGITRSNGLILCGYLIYRALRRISQTVKYRITDTFLQIVRTCLPELLRLGCQLFLCVAPFVMFQVYACMLYCVPYLISLSNNLPKHVQELAHAKNYLMPSETSPPWCYSSIPFPYAYVQSHYWDVGFLRYYELKQIPNFLLAIPLIVLLAWFCKSWFDDISKPWLSLDRLFQTFEEDGFAPYILHVIGQTVLCILFIHIQVTTRLTCASSPIPYWAGASLLAFHWQAFWKKVKREQREENPSYCHVISFLVQILLWGKDNQRVVVAYFLLYIVVGTAMFTNYYPWT